MDAFCAKRVFEVQILSLSTVLLAIKLAHELNVLLGVVSMMI
jgi:hypothetical protein